MRVWRVAGCLLLFGMGLWSGAATSADGDRLLARNQHAEARTAYQEALKADAQDPRALLGLAKIAELEDTPIDELQYWRRYYTAAPASWPAMASWARVLMLASDTGKWTLLDGIARDILASKTAPSELRASAREALIALQVQAGKFADADAAWQRLGYLRQWYMVGPFDNVCKSGFAKVFPPEREIDFTKTYPGYSALPHGWLPCTFIQPNGDCLLEASLGGGDASVYYAVTAVNAPQAQPARLCLDSTGAARVFLNGTQVFADDQYRKAAYLVADPFSVPVTLRQGWNTLLVKMASDETTAAEFRLRFTTAAGDDLLLPVDPREARTPTVVAPPAETPRQEPAAVRLLRAQAPTADVLAAIGSLLIDARDTDAAITALRAAVAQQPETGWLHWELSRALRADSQEDEARLEREAAHKADARIVACELADLDDHEEESKSAQHIAQLKTLLAALPNSPSLRWSLANAYDNEDLMKEAYAEGAAVLQLAGGEDNIVRLYWLYQYNDRDTEALKILAAGLKAFPYSATLLEIQAEQLNNQKKYAAALATYQKLLQVVGPQAQHREEMASICMARQQNADAVAHLTAVCALMPQHARKKVALGDLLHELKQTKEALACYRQALALNPASSADLREKIRVITKEPAEIDLAPAIDAAPILKRAATLKAPKDTSAVMLLDELRMIVYPDYFTEAHEHLIIKVFDDAGVERFKNISPVRLRRSSNIHLEKARIIKADGKIQDVTGDDDEGDAAFPGLAPGDTVEMSYRVEDYEEGALAGNFWKTWIFDTSDVAVERSRFVLITPPGMSYQVKTHGDVAAAQVSDSKGWRVAEWSLANLPAVKDEPAAPGQNDINRWVDISTITSWADIARWYTDIVGPRAAPDGAVKAKAAELTKDAKTEEEKLRALIAFVSRDIRYESCPFRMSAFVPTACKQVLRERYGDCKDKATLLKALLAAVGISADVVLINNRDNGVTPLLPSPRFEHAINRINTAKGPLWVDTTADDLEFGGFPLPLQDVPALVITDGAADLAPTPLLPLERYRSTIAVAVQLDDHDRLRGQMTTATGGWWGSMFRSGLKQIPQNKMDLFFQQVVPFIITNAVSDGGSVDNLLEVEKPLTLHLKYHIEQPGTRAGDFLIIPPVWPRMDQVANTLPDEPRTQDMEVSTGYGVWAITVTLTLPKGYQPAEIPAKVEETSPWGAYAVTQRLDGAALILTLTKNNTVLRVPAADYAQYRAYVMGMIKQVTKPVVLKRG